MCSSEVMVHAGLVVAANMDTNVRRLNISVSPEKDHAKARLGEHVEDAVEDSFGVR